MESDDKMFKYIDEVFIDKQNKEVYIYMSPKMLYAPDHIATHGIPKYTEISQHKPIIVDTKEATFIKGPLRVGSGVLLIINNNLIPLQLRDEHVRYYKKMFNDFSGHVGAGETIMDTAMKEFYEEVLFIDIENKCPIFLTNDRLYTYDMSVYKTSAQVAKESYKLDINSDNIIVLPSQFIQDKDIYTIIVYDNRRKVNEFKGMIMYDKDTNSLEITILISAELDVNKITILSLETIGTPVVLFTRENLKNVKFSFLTPRVREIRKIL